MAVSWRNCAKRDAHPGKHPPFIRMRSTASRHLTRGGILNKALKFQINKLDRSASAGRSFIFLENSLNPLSRGCDPCPDRHFGGIDTKGIEFMNASKSIALALVATLSLVASADLASARAVVSGPAPSAPSAEAVEEGDGIQQARQRACESQGGSHASGSRCLDRNGNSIDR